MRECAFTEMLLYKKETGSSTPGCKCKGGGKQRGMKLKNFSKHKTKCAPITNQICIPNAFYRGISRQRGSSKTRRLLVIQNRTDQMQRQLEEREKKRNRRVVRTGRVKRELIYEKQTTGVLYGMRGGIVGAFEWTVGTLRFMSPGE